MACMAVATWVGAAKDKNTRSQSLHKIAQPLYSLQCQAVQIHIEYLDEKTGEWYQSFHLNLFYLFLNIT